jgi:hypothetical protein
MKRSLLYVLAYELFIYFLFAVCFGINPMSWVDSIRIIFILLETVVLILLIAYTLSDDYF